MSVTQVGDLVRLVAQQLGAIEAGDNPSADEYSDCVDWLNVMLRNWDADESLQPNLVSASFPTVSGTSSYTVGLTGVFVTARPLRIMSAYVRWQGVDTQLGVGGKADYNKLQNKSQAGPVCVLYYIPSYPLGTIYFDRVPDQAYTVFCDMQSPWGDYADQNALLSVSPEVHAAILFNLCIYAAPVFKAEITPSMAALARRALERIQYQRHIVQTVESWPSSDLVV